MSAEVKGRGPGISPCLGSRGGSPFHPMTGKIKTVSRPGMRRAASKIQLSPTIIPSHIHSPCCLGLQPPSESHPKRATYKAHKIPNTDLWSNNPTWSSCPGDIAAEAPAHRCILPCPHPRTPPGKPKWVPESDGNSSHLNCRLYHQGFQDQTASVFSCSK